MEKREELYAGKAKSVLKTDDPDKMVLVFRDDTSAFDGKKVEQLDRKGMVNNKFNAFIMTKLQEAGIPTHFESLLSDTECLVKCLDMMPVECVVRNIAAGSLCRRLGVEEGVELTPPTFELFLKNDELGDPLIAREHILEFKWGSQEELKFINNSCLRINDFLQGMFRGVGIKLVDFKVEFGKFEKNGKKEIILADEISPDTCRLWDVNSDKKLDKDRFRKGLGNLIEAYQEVARRLDILHEQSNVRPLKYTKPQAVKIKKK